MVDKKSYQLVYSCKAVAGKECLMIDDWFVFARSLGISMSSKQWHDNKAKSEMSVMDDWWLMIDALSPKGNTLNQGEWKAMENSWADALSNGKDEKVKIKVKFEGNSKRPSRYEVEYSINGGDIEREMFNN